MNTYTKAMIVSGELAELIEVLFKAQSKGSCTIFLEISGHVQLINVRIYKGSWIPDTEADFVSNIYIDDDKGSFKINKLRKKVIAFLNSIPETNGMINATI